MGFSYCSSLFHLIAWMRDFEFLETLALKKSPSSVPYPSCCMYLVPSRSSKHQSWLLLPRTIHPTRTEALHENRTCLLFQLPDILFRGSYPGPYSLHCYPFMTAPAWLATDVCNTSPGEINCFPQAQFLTSNHSAVSNVGILKSK